MAEVVQLAGEDIKEIEKNKVLVMLGLEQEDLKKLSLNDEVVSKYMSELDKLNKSTLFRRYMTEEEDKRKIFNSRISSAEKKGLERGMKKGLERGMKKGMKKGIEQGIEQGIERGIEQGIEQGENNKSIEIAKNMLNKNMNINIISEVTGLSKEEIENLK